MRIGQGNGDLEKPRNGLRWSLSGVSVGSGRGGFSRGALGLASVPLPFQALIGLELVTVLVDLFVEADGLVREELIRRPSGRT